ncbi:hypothetical protein FB45DRAFT_923690 [Roridomyces roridus]|uniref:MYND-type domain-containing protein n=1 Tax=Roridomyces roridus TaxID=1738132 RepID=A0AAD7BLP1_9AGAR|nr:hypothetical protein FB45DRAFT_923690 [Roridomyces roridus]
MTTTNIRIPLAEHADADADKWNMSWESLFGGIVFISPQFCFVDMVNRNEIYGLKNTLASYPHLLSNTCDAQYYLTLDARQCFDEHDFEARWLAASPEERSPHVLGALAAVCSKSQNLNMARVYCRGELRIWPLCNEPEMFFDLLRSAMLDDIDATAIPKQPKYIMHSSWDEVLAGDEADDLREVTKAGLMLLRTKLICYVFDFILRSFCSLETPILTASYVDPILERESHEPVASVASIRERTVERRPSCSYLRCLKLAPADGSVIFNRCGRCFSQIRRQGFYCSRECQVADWKLRHKKTCGKTPTFDDVSTLPEYPAAGVLAAAVPVFL